MINEERLCALFMELCAIDAEPTRERPMADCLTALLAERGFTVTEDDAAEKIGGTAGNLIARHPGVCAGETLLFSCHMDRVFPGAGCRPRRDGDLIVSDGTTVLGADDAAGLAAVLEALTAVQEAGLPYPGLEVVFSAAEELSLLGSRHLDTASLTSRCGFVLDASGPVGEIVLQAPEQVRIDAVFHGRSAHAGFTPEQGVSAIQAAALAITRMHLLRVDDETTANIGSIQAQGPTNIVSPRCELQAEARSLDPARLATQVAGMVEAMETAAADLGGSVETRVQSCYPSYRLAEDAGPARRAARAARSLGLPVRFKASGGGSDANIFNSRGIPAVVLCCGYEQVHTTAERIPVQQLGRLAAWVAAIMTGTAEQVSRCP